MSGPAYDTIFDRLCLGRVGGLCKSPHVVISGIDLCNYCTKLALTNLEADYAITPSVEPGLPIIPDYATLVGKSKVEEIRKNRERRTAEARAWGVSVCALENPIWDNEPSRKAFKPTSPIPCELIDAPEYNEYAFPILCSNCVAHEAGSSWWRHHVILSDKECPYPRLKIGNREGPSDEKVASPDEPEATVPRVLGGVSVFKREK